MPTQDEYWTGRWDRGLDSWTPEMVGRPGHVAWMGEQFRRFGFAAIADGQSVLDVGCAAGNNLFILDRQRTISYRGIDTHPRPISLGTAKATARSLASTFSFVQTRVITAADWIICTWVLMEMAQPAAAQLLLDMAANAAVGVILNYDQAPTLREDAASDTNQDHGGWLVLPSPFIANRMAPLALDAAADRRIVQPRLGGVATFREIWRV
jgi:SAM-dependent methyltransferase